jgi:hypothetical protein
LPSITELPGDSSIAGHSVFSLTPEIELALVAADDSVDAGCWDVLVVSSDSRLLRWSSCFLTRSVGLMAEACVGSAKRSAAEAEAGVGVV